MRISSYCHTTSERYRRPRAAENDARLKVSRLEVYKFRRKFHLLSSFGKTDTYLTSIRQGSAPIPAVQSTHTMDMDGSSRTSRVPVFNGTSQDDYGLWRLRLRAELRTKGVWKYVNPNTSSSTSSTTSGTTALADNVEVLEKASAIIISSIGDGPLRVIEDVDDDPQKMLRMLDERYASNRATSRIAVQTQLYRKVYGGGWHGHICR